MSLLIRSCLALALLLTTARDGFAQSNPPCGTFLTQWGSSGSGEGQFLLPFDIAVDGSGNVYVADTGNDRIQKFSDTGAFLSTWGSYGIGNGQFIQPWGVAVDGSGNVFVVDGRIQKFTSDGTFLSAWGSYGSGNGQFSAATDIAVDGSGHVFVADSGNSRIQKFSDTGTFLTAWGSPGNEDGQFNTPYRVAVDGSGNVYVTDSGNARIQKFTNTGSFILKWGTYGSGNGQFINPTGIAVYGSGYVFVTDTDNNLTLGPPARIEVFTNTGTFLTTWGSPGGGDGQFADPYGVAVDGSGHVFVADTTNFRIQKFACPCGNGQVDPGEQCDDGNTSNGDCCNSLCQFEAAASPCNDHNTCTSGEVCNPIGQCVGFTACNTALTCDFCGSKCKVTAGVCKCG